MRDPVSAPLDFLTSDNQPHTWEAACGFDIEADDVGMRNGATQDRHEPHPWQAHIGRVLALGRHEQRIEFSWDRLANIGHGCLSGWYFAGTISPKPQRVKAYLMPSRNRKSRFLHASVTLSPSLRSG